MFRQLESSFLSAVSLTILCAASPLSAAPGPVRSIGPEGYVDNLLDLRHPDPAEPGYLLALTHQAVWASRNGGASWLLLTPDFRFPGSLGNLAIDPFDRKHWLLAAADLDAENRWFYWLVETRDAGGTWTWRPFPDSRRGSRLQFDDGSPGVVAYYDFFGAFVSLDNGQSFAPIPRNPAHLGWPTFLAAHRGLLYFQADQALWTYQAVQQQWTRIGPPLPFSIDELRGDLARADTLFARDNGDLYRSRDGGRTFERILDRFATFPFEKFLQSSFNSSHLAVISQGKILLSLDRGTTWAEEPRGTGGYFASAAAFDPATGELIFHEDGSLVRRHLDGNRQKIRPRGLYAAAFLDVVPDPARDRLWALASDGALFRRDGDNRAWTLAGQAPCSESLAVTPWNPSRIFVTCFAAYFFSDDGGATWSSGGAFDAAAYYAPMRIVFGPGEPGSTWLLAPLDQLFSLEGVSPRVQRFNVADVLFHPDPQQGLLASYSDTYEFGFLEWQPAGGWNLLSSDTSKAYYQYLAQVPGDPRRVFSLSSFGGVDYSGDRGRTWEFRGSTRVEGGGILPQVGSTLRVDPRDPDHLVAGGEIPLSESWDGGRSWSFENDFRYSQAVAFDPAGNLFNAGFDSLQMRSAADEGCAGREDNFCARQERFELTVEWKTPNGATGVAKKVETGSQESGLFYFFDPNNWELLVKVLDGCGLNQRFWVFTAGTTDVEYLLKVEDRWTGKIRSYWNQPGRAAEAVADTDAFATCGTPAPALAAPVAPALAPAKAAMGEGGSLDLVGGRFRVDASWTDFAGQHGNATPAPLLSANSGLFWFFSPDNWEVLIKVLDGCAINGHFWVLAAATTDVGYELRVAEPARGREKVYRNPVGVPSPAQLDLQAFSCSG